MKKSQPSGWSANQELRVHFALQDMNRTCQYIEKVTSDQGPRDTEQAELMHGAMSLARYYERLAEIDPDDMELAFEASAWQSIANELLAGDLPDELRD